MNRENGVAKSDMKFSLVAAMMGIVVSIVVAVWLLSASVLSAKRLHAARMYATEVPPMGSLSGHGALDGSRWLYLGGDDQYVILFLVAADGKPGDSTFWQEVAARSAEKDPEVLFVGLCLSSSGCNPPVDSETALTVLAFMDPAQVRAISRASSMESALVYRGQRLQRTMSIRIDKQDLVNQIVELSSRQQVMGGA